jgi:hypothetical protein
MGVGVCVCGGEETHTPDPKGEKRKIQLTKKRKRIIDTPSMMMMMTIKKRDGNK